MGLLCSLKAVGWSLLLIEWPDIRSAVGADGRDNSKSLVIRLFEVYYLHDSISKMLCRYGRYGKQASIDHCIRCRKLRRFHCANLMRP